MIPRGKDEGINLVSWNVHGLGHSIKRAKVFAHLNSLAADVAFLQETHIRPFEQKRLRCSWADQIFQSTFSSKARGVAIIIRKNIPFKHISTLCDPNGRYIIVTGHLHSIHVTLLNIYGPNIDDAAFFRKTFEKLPDLSNTNLIVAGDHNVILDLHLDRSASKICNPSNASTVLNNLIISTNLVDIWRLQHPTDREYSFFSNKHKSYSRIDFFLLDAKLIPNVTNTKYHNILISDHAPASITLNFKKTGQRSSWRLRPSLLADEKFCKHMSVKITEYLENNDTSDVSDSTLWETFKAVMRGHIIAYEAALKKTNKTLLDEIDSEITQLESLYRSTGNSQTLNNILNLKYEYNTILSRQVCDQLLRLRRQYFELGDKPHTLLTRQLRGQQASRAIHKIKSRSGVILTDPKLINSRFKEYYEELYRSKATGDVDNWLKDLNIPKLDDTTRESLNAELSPEEILDSIRSMQNGKSSGPDGFGVEFYKIFANQMTPILHRMFSHSMESERLPPTLYDANISLLLKQDRDETEPSSYRPVSMLNLDFKIFTKILANRLNKCIESIIHTDQTGFIPNRYSFFNVRCVMDIMYYSFDKYSKQAILCLDAEKAFDQVEWPYLTGVLEKFGLGPSFISWVRMIYFQPTASVLTNLDRSPSFPLQRGTRQGCPLSPLLFALAIEPLAISVREHVLIKPITLGGVDHKISLYADSPFCIRP